MTKKKENRKDCPHCEKNLAESYIQRHIKNQHPKRYEEKDGGRPQEYSPKDINQSLKKYVKKNEIPVIKEFCIEYGILYRTFYDIATRKDGRGEYKNEQLFHTYKQCINKKEVNLEKGMLEGDLSISAAKFSLKQLGWNEKQEVEHSGGLSLGELARRADQEDD